MLCQGICDKLIIAIENLSRNEYSKRFFFILLTSGNALLFLKLCVFLISSPPPPVLFRNFQKWLEMVLFSARLGNGICSGTNHWCWSLAGNKKWPISKLSRENILKWPDHLALTHSTMLMWGHPTKPLCWGSSSSQLRETQQLHPQWVLAWSCK